jgi:outer membrane protein TolC
LAFALAATGLAGAAETAGPLRLDLNECVDMAIEVNVSVLKAGYSLDRAKYGVLGSASGQLPSASWSSSGGRRQGTSDWVFVDGNWQWVVFPDEETYRASFSFSERLSVPSAMGLLESSAYMQAARQDLRAARQQAAFLAKQKYLEVLKAGRLLGVKEEAVELSKRRLEKAQAMLDVGSGVRSDVLRAQVEASSNQLDLITAKNGLRLAETDLKHFLALPDDRELEVEDILETTEVSVTLDDALPAAMEARPDVRAQQHVVKAAGRAVWKERGGWLPSFGINYSRSYSAKEWIKVVPEHVSDLWDEAPWSWGTSLSLNLFDGFGTFSQVKAAKAALKSAKEDLNQTRRDAALEIRQAVYNVDEARQRVKVSKETVSLAEEELRLAEERYRLGGGTMLEQIDAQVALSEARTSHIQALYDLLSSQAELARAMGKD